MINEKTFEHFEKPYEGNTKHGKSKTKIYGAWHNIKQRCLNPNNRFYEYYGGRGIKICDRWLDFANFLADMGEPEAHLTIDRIDNNGNYCPENCKWATRKEQQNNRRTNKFLTFNGAKKTAMQWSEELGIPHQTICQRIELGWEVKDILNPMRQYNKEGLKLGGNANGARQRAKTRCKNGHPFDEQNTSFYKGNRRCKTCHRIREAERRLS